MPSIRHIQNIINGYFTLYIDFKNKSQIIKLGTYACSAYTSPLPPPPPLKKKQNKQINKNIIKGKKTQIKEMHNLQNN